MNHPFRFLLQFEWALLTIAAIGEFIHIPPFRVLRSMAPIAHLPWVNLGILLIFGLLSLKIPAKDSRYLWIYGASLVGLVAIAAFGTGFQFLPLLCIVLVLRCGVIFESSVSWSITGITFLMGAASQVYDLLHFRLPRVGQMAIRRAARFGMPNDVNGADLVEPVISRLFVSALSSILLLGLVLLFVQVLMATLVAERKNREALAIANQQLQDYAAQAEMAATLQERNRISREIHDSLGHSLTASNLHLEAALRLLKSDPEEAIDLLQEAKRLGSETLKSVRDSVKNLRSEDPLKGQTLSQAIELLLQDWSRSTQIQTACDIATELPQIPESLKIASYRIIQEALTNITRHAQATKVGIKISVQLQSAGLHLTIQDNGRGFIVEQTGSGFGLQGMEERTIALNGLFSVNTAPGQGCRISVIFPLNPQPTRSV